jgi:hypothetical protein
MYGYRHTVRGEYEPFVDRSKILDALGLSLYTEKYTKYATGYKDFYSIKHR